MPEDPADDGYEAARILVVDADESTRVTLKLLLELNWPGTTVEMTAHPTEALRMLDQRPFDLVIASSNFPDVDARAFLAEVRRFAPRPRSLLVDAPWTVQHDDLPCDDAIGAPLEPDEFLLKVGRLLARPSEEL